MSGLHTVLGKRAYELLPDWEQDFWKSEKEQIPEYCFYPDRHLEAQWISEEKMAYYSKYCVMPNGLCIPHGPVDSDWKCACFASDIDHVPIEYTVGYYFDVIIDLLRKGDVSESAKFACTLGHFIQDSSIPVHAMNNITINRLFPEQNGKYFFYHRVVDGMPFKPELITCKPKLLGRNKEETVFAITEKVICIIEKNMGLLVPLLTAIRDGNEQEADRINQNINAEAVSCTIDVWHTLFSIAFNRFEPEETAYFKWRDLTDSRMILSYNDMFNRDQFIKAGIPFYETIFTHGDPWRARLSTDPYAYEPSCDFAYDGKIPAKGNLMPLALQIDGKRQEAPRGVAAGGYGIASFRVPGKVFSKLDVYAGIYPDAVRKGTMTFAVWCYEAEQPLLAKGQVSEGDDALHFVIDIPENCRTISLLSAAEGIANTNAVWLSPRLKYRKN